MTTASRCWKYSEAKKQRRFSQTLVRADDLRLIRSSGSGEMERVIRAEEDGRALAQAGIEDAVIDLFPDS